MSRTITGHTTVGIKLSNTADNPVKVAATASVITTGSYAIDGTNVAAWTLTNLGTLSAAAFGVTLASGGKVTNGSTSDAAALITGTRYGVKVDGSGGTVTNFGSIAGGTDGVLLDAGGIVDNGKTGVVSGAGGVAFVGAGTLTNAGTITGTNGTAVRFGSGAERLIADPGAVFVGHVIGGSGTNVMELASAASTGTISGIGTSFTNFGTIDFDRGAKWKVAGKAADLRQTITGFATGDTIDVTDFVAVSKTFASNTLVLTNAAAAHVTLDIHGSFVSADFRIVTDHASGTFVELVCFAAGTHIAMPGGSVAVEDLRVGDPVLTADARALPVHWLGVQTVATRFADPVRALPIRIRAGALGEQLPSRDLLLSPCHAVLIDGILINAGALVNGTSITRVTNVPELLRYYHVELDEHVLLLAESVTAESFLDGSATLPFDSAADRMPRPVPDELPYPRVKEHRQVPSPVRARIAARATTLGVASRAA